MNEATEPPTEATAAIPAVEAAPEAAQLPASEVPPAQDVLPQPVPAEAQAAAPEAPADVAEVTATTEGAPMQATESIPAPVPARGRGRGRGRGSKRGSAPTSAAASASTSTASTGAARGRGKRKSEGAPNAADVAAAREPRKKRKVAMNSKRIVESDSDGDSAMYEDSILPSPAAAVEEAAVQPEQSTSTMQVDEPVSTIQPEATAMPPIEEVNVQEPVRKQSLKVKLGFKRGSTAGQTESPTETSTGEVAATSNTAEPASTALDAIAAISSVSQEPSTSSTVAESSQIQEAPSISTEAKEETVAVPDLFADDEPSNTKPLSSQSKKSPSIPVDKVPTPTSTEAMSPKVTDKAAKTKTSTSKIPGAGAMEKKASTSGGTPTGKSAVPPKKPQPASKTITSLNKPSAVAKGSVTPAGASPGGSGLIKKRVPKPGVGGTSTPKTQQHTTAPPPQAETSFLDALFADTIPQTDHERQLQREREERSRKEAAAKAKKAKEEADAKKKASLAASASAAASAASAGKPSAAAGLVPAGGKPPPVGLPSLKTIPAQRQPGTSVLSRLGGSERLRQQEIAKMRVEARQQQEKLAAEGGFDLLSQGIEMGGVEVPFLREWRSHQGMIFSNAREGEPFHFYKGAPPKYEENESGPIQLRSLPHPWTFGSAFAFAGSKPEQQEQWK